MSRKLNRRTFLAGTAAGTAAATLQVPRPRDCPRRALQDRPADRQDRPAGAGRHPDGAGHRHVPEGEEQHAGRPQGGAAGRRYRRQPGRRQDQGAGGDRARQGQRHPGAARRLRAAGHHRLRARQRHAADQPGRGRGRDAAQGQSVRHPPLRDLGAMQPRDGRLRRQGAEAQARGHHLRGLRLRPRADGRRSSACSRTTAARWSRSCGRRW